MTGEGDGWEGGRALMAIMKWMHVPWNECIIGNPTETG